MGNEPLPDSGRVAAIDIGTHSVLLLVAESERGALRAVLERATITRLGEGVDRNGSLLEAACARTLSCLAGYARELAEHRVTRLDAVGTSALRDASGGLEFVARAAKILGVAPRVIDGQEEARLTFAGAVSGIPEFGNVTVFDIGGGSTEIINGRVGPSERAISSSVSLNIGSVRLYERHLRSDPPSPAQMQSLEREIVLALNAARKPEPSTTLIGVAGTITQLAALELELAHYDGARVHGRVLTRSTVARLAAQLASLALGERRALPGMEPARADVLVAGSAIARGVLDWSGATQLIVSDRGVRWGLAHALVGEH